MLIAHSRLRYNSWLKRFKATIQHTARSGPFAAEHRLGCGCLCFLHRPKSRARRRRRRSTGLGRSRTGLCRSSVGGRCHCATDLVLLVELGHFSRGRGRNSRGRREHTRRQGTRRARNPVIARARARWRLVNKQLPYPKTRSPVLLVDGVCLGGC